ncbi:MAG: queuine tRNA-ribosyltransferase family protein [Armatimonadota bacterium]|nr:MAG: queuine tRNA-ribosyltransferase family protein [Armatimonadota bacterium]
MRELRTAHGVIQLPAFLPDATRGVVRAVDSDDLARVGVEGIVVNVLHLSSAPGASVISSLGGIGRFMGWKGVVACDSGGFQVYSLIARSANLGSVTERGFTYRLGQGRAKETLTPEKCIERQFQIGADLMFCLDYCTHPEAPEEVQRESVERTVAWARRCKEEFARRLEGVEPGEPRPMLFAVVQGGADRDLRRSCAEELLEIGFDGYGYGGWPVGSEGGLVETVEYVRELVPREFPLHGLGIGKPESIVRCVGMGYDLFDCTLPTRDARHGRLYVSTDGFATLDEEAGAFYEHVRIEDDRYRRDERPVEEGCDCPACRGYSRSYLRHLFEIGDAAGWRLATLHNLRFYARLMAGLQSRR